MSLPDRYNPYNFDEFLQWRNQTHFLTDDPFLQNVIAYYANDLSDSAHADLTQFASRLSQEWQHLADDAGRPEHAPSLLHFDGHNNRIDRIQRPMSTLALEQAVWNEGIFSERVDPWTRFIKIFLLCQLGEAGINCAHCCTGGLILILEQVADTPELNAILHHLKEGANGEFAIGAQFLSEIQGGSDVSANAVEAVHTEGTWRIYGTKFYCSAAHADYAIITAKPKGSHDVGVFVVPAWLPGDKPRERRNGYVINKLKSKLGTRELPTAEITYQGAVAYPVGDLRRGLANIVGIVLSHSRFVTGLSAGAQLTRVSREAHKYAEWRTAFGMPIQQYGLVAMQLSDLEYAARRTTAGAFQLQSELIALETRSMSSPTDQDEVSIKQHECRVRILIMLQKLVACADSAALNDTAMSLFGGHGLMEDFSSLPRLFRDASTLNGAWEGPRNLLLTRIYKDLRAAVRWYPANTLIQDMLPATPSEETTPLIAELTAILNHPSLTGTDEATQAICRRWDTLCQTLFHAYQAAAYRKIIQSV